MYRSAPSNPGADVIIDGFPRRTAGGSFRFRLKMGRKRTETLNVTTLNIMEKISQEIYASMCTFNWVRLRFLRLEKGEIKNTGTLNVIRLQPNYFVQ